VSNVTNDVSNVVSNDVIDSKNNLEVQSIDESNLFLMNKIKATITNTHLNIILPNSYSGYTTIDITSVHLLTIKISGGLPGGTYQLFFTTKGTGAINNNIGRKVGNVMCYNVFGGNFTLRTNQLGTGTILFDGRIYYLSLIGPYN
jgi:hypothetical protein